MENEVVIRLGFFFGIFIIVALWEVISPRRVLTTSKPARWYSNMGIILIDSLAVRFLLPIPAVGLAVMAENNGWGLLNNMELPLWLSVFAGVLALDLIIYLQHVMFHSVPILWRLHMMHHADLDYDVTTGLRFHPVEILISMAIKFSAIVVIGPSPYTAVLFEIILNATAMFNHGNIRLPLGVDKVLRLLVVTPDMHRVHHSVTIRETNSNFGFNFPWWDRLLGTYRPQPVAGHEGMTIGLAQFRDARKLTLPWLLALPFIGEPGSYAINRSGREPVRAEARKNKSAKEQ
jgi:sterol desaturase/sphingolipid hydroxylase (fatty acid hydroxylase superfamily)